MHIPGRVCLHLALLLGACLTSSACSGLPGPFSSDAAAPSAPARTWTSIAGAPASQPCCGAPAPAPAGVAPGEVWCYVKVAAQACTRRERVLVAPGRWEWQRSRSCELPGAEPGVGAGPEVRGDLSGGVRPGEVWCQVWNPPVYEDRVVEEPVSAARWEWRRTQECDVPVSAAPAVR